MIPQLTYPLATSSNRVRSIRVPGDEHPRSLSADSVMSGSDKREIINAAYMQIFHLQQMFAQSRNSALESQFYNGQINVRELIRGLLTSVHFREYNYNCNNNYRFVEICIQRVLGRKVYNDQEKHAWSIVLATQGLNGFVDQLLNSEEYLEHFGFNAVPYQRNRTLPQRAIGDFPFERMARYGDNYRNQITAFRPIPPADLSASVYKRVLFLPVMSAAVLLLVIWSSLVA